MSRLDRRVGIEKLRVYPCSLSLDMLELCEARQHDVTEIKETMMVDERSVNPLYEDPITMAVNAARPMLTAEELDSIELLIVGSESGVDQEKSISTWVHRYLGLKSNCRNFEIKHACYGGTAGLSMAVSWILSGLDGDARALVITTDQSRMHLGMAHEFVLGGCGAAAALVSSRPRLLELEPGKNGYWTNEVSDVTRPTSRVETGNSDTSLLSYLDGLHGAYTHYVERAGGSIDFDTYFKKNVYHVPFGGITFLAHRELLRRDREMSKLDARRDFDRKAAPALHHTRRMGSTYTSSIFAAMLGLIDSAPDLEPGDRVGIFSYGSGACAEFYSGLVCPEAWEVAASANLGGLLDLRRRISVGEYETIERQRTEWIDQGDYDPLADGYDEWYLHHYAGQGYLTFRGMRDYVRQYAWT